MSDARVCRLGPLLPLTREDVAPFLQRWHYMTYVPTKTSLKFFGSREPDTGELACVIALNHRPTNQHVARKHFGDGWKALNIGELSRMACRDVCPKLTETMFLGRALKLVRRLGYDAMISYADMAVGHEGTIYRASNWYYTGFVAPNPKFFVDTSVLANVPVEESRKRALEVAEQIEPLRRRRVEYLWGPATGIWQEVNWRQCRHRFNASHGAGLKRRLGDRFREEPGYGKHRFVYCLTRKAKGMLEGGLS